MMTLGQFDCPIRPIIPVGHKTQCYGFIENVTSKTPGSYRKNMLFIHLNHSYYDSQDVAFAA